LLFGVDLNIYDAIQLTIGNTQERPYRANFTLR